MLRVIVSGGPKPVGNKGWLQQTVGVYFFDEPGQEAPFPSPIPILLEPGSAGYAPGAYTMDPASLQPRADSYGKLFISAGRLVLVPVKGAGK
jgi:hypothetical protein